MSGNDQGIADQWTEAGEPSLRTAQVAMTRNS